MCVQEGDCGPALLHTQVCTGRKTNAPMCAWMGRLCACMRVPVWHEWGDGVVVTSTALRETRTSE